MVITSPHNPRVKGVVRLRKRRHRDDTGTFIVEGRREATRAVAAGVDIATLFLQTGEIPPAGIDADIVDVSPAVFAKMSARQGPDGVLAVARTWDLGLDRIKTTTGALVLVAAGIEKPGNLGAMLRTADAAGVDAVVLADPVCDPFGPNVVRASQGSLFSVPLGAGSAAEVLAWLDRADLEVFTTSPTAETAYWEHDYSEGAAFVIGPEDVGLSGLWFESGTPVRIPMAGEADSLNASVAAGIVLFEAVAARSR
ncbi:MAG: RNA methyltransferase [Acidimicrobiia bacterium]|nr:RNA methyltransferase [Acidimicrobiia bacterium]NNF68844.1 RNA methyltransferase [Acidimicrobiia bacterium]